MSSELNIYILEYADAMPSAVSGVQDIFTIANHQAEEEIFTICDLTSDVYIVKNKTTVIFIPPCLANELPAFSSPETLSLLRRWYNEGAVIVSACAGVYWLANAGLLDGKEVTTHWKLCQRLADEFPNIQQVNGREIIVDQGNIVTAAGIYAYQDLTLHIIARFFGYSLAKKVADFCLLDLNGRLQAYYQRFYPNLSHGDKTIIKAQLFCSDQIHLNHTVTDIAVHCHISKRTLLRRFKSATSYTPKQYIIQLKVEKAKQIMEQGVISIDEISNSLGYADSSNFIKVFKKIAGITPSEFKVKQKVSELADHAVLNAHNNKFNRDK